MLIPDDIKGTISGLLESAIAGTESIIRTRDSHGLHKFATTEEEWLAHYKVALEWLSAQEQPPVALDFPDGPGWWAGRANDLRQFTVWWTEFAIVGDELRVHWGDDDYTMTYELADFKRNYLGCKWFRLHMPWDTQPQGVTAGAQRRPGGA